MSTKNATLYDTDFYAWANQQAALLRAGKLSEADIENIAEEIESMGKSEKRELINRLAVLLHHLLKWRYQPGFRGKSWQLTVEEQRLRVSNHLRDNPSLKSHLDDAMRTAFRYGRIQAEKETGLSSGTFPADCPFTFDEAMNPDFWPD
jgi:hypothetical protein